MKTIYKNHGSKYLSKCFYLFLSKKFILISINMLLKDTLNFAKINIGKHKIYFLKELIDIINAVNGSILLSDK